MKNRGRVGELVELGNLRNRQSPDVQLSQDIEAYGRGQGFSKLDELVRISLLVKVVFVDGLPAGTMLG